MSHNKKLQYYLQFRSLLLVTNVCVSFYTSLDFLGFLVIGSYVMMTVTSIEFVLLANRFYAHTNTQIQSALLDGMAQ